MLGNAKPELRDLHKYIVPKYATKWEELGLLLKVPTHHLDIIKCDHPSSCKECCKAMFKKWMEITLDATWDKLRKAINELPSSKESTSVLLIKSNNYVIRCCLFTVTVQQSYSCNSIIANILAY